ncbi:hypothetical protein EYF80_040001 [Liparis tanakae]|uniref:Uncharacterized protein n=1 Tax=Liparis tanakae TaxID=230148 RepID=A0A4Z2G8A1_9TELE|nr:hypothetical protein EYF80_040001 [Liparis tanakae]
MSRSSSTERPASRRRRRCDLHQRETGGAVISHSTQDIKLPLIVPQPSDTKTLQRVDWSCDVVLWREGCSELDPEQNSFDIHVSNECLESPQDSFTFLREDNDEDKVSKRRGRSDKC